MVQPTRIAGKEFLHKVTAGGSLALLGARFGVDPERLARAKRDIDPEGADSVLAAREGTAMRIDGAR